MDVKGPDLSKNCSQGYGCPMWSHAAACCGHDALSGAKNVRNASQASLALKPFCKIITTWSPVRCTHCTPFQECAMDGDLPIPWRVLGVSLFALLALYRFMILMVSLPPHREAPAHRCLQPFFIADTRELAKHMAEAAAANTDSWQKCYEAG